MSQRSLRRAVIIPIVWTFLLPITASAQSHDDDSEKALRGLVEKFNSAYKQENGPEVIGEVLSDLAFAYARPTVGEAGPVARVLSKPGYVEAFKKFLWKKNLRKHEHRIDSLTVLGGLAYEFGTILDVTEEGIEQQSEVFNVFAKEEAGWKLVFSTVPDFFKGRSASASAEAEAVREAARKFIATFNSKDPTPFAEFEGLLAGDVVAVQSDGTMLQGRGEVVKYYQNHVEQLRESFRNADLSWKTMDVKMLGGGATVFGKLLIQGEKREGGETIRQETWETLVFRKDTTGWKLTEEHSTSASKPESKKS